MSKTGENRGAENPMNSGVYDPEIPHFSSWGPGGRRFKSCLPDELQNWEQAGTRGKSRENAGARSRLFSAVPGYSRHSGPQKDRRNVAAVLRARAGWQGLLLRPRAKPCSAIADHAVQPPSSDLNAVHELDSPSTFVTRDPLAATRVLWPVGTSQTDGERTPSYREPVTCVEQPPRPSPYIAAPCLSRSAPVIHSLPATSRYLSQAER